MQAVVKSTSNGERPQGQSRAELRGNTHQGVETSAESDRVAARTKQSIATGAVPSRLNGGHETRARQSSNDSRRYSPTLRATEESTSQAANARRTITTEHHLMFRCQAIGVRSLPWPPHFPSDKSSVTSPFLNASARSDASGESACAVAAATNACSPKTTSEAVPPSPVDTSAESGRPRSIAPTGRPVVTGPGSTERGRRCGTALVARTSTSNAESSSPRNGSASNRSATTSLQRSASLLSARPSIGSTTIVDMSRAMFAGRLQRFSSRTHPSPSTSRSMVLPSRSSSGPGCLVLNRRSSTSGSPPAGSHPKQRRRLFGG